jgi:two-component SAPR family response regulator
MSTPRRFHTVTLCFLCSLCALADETASGLLFTSSAEKVDKRTSLTLFSDELQRFEDSFHINFDLSIRDVNQFGHILRVINDRKQEVEFVFVNFYGNNSIYLDFHSPITHQSVQIPITQDDIDRKTLLHIHIGFDLKNDKASITLRDSVYTCSPVGLENPSRLSFAFGLYGLNLDVPHMLIKNLHIQTEQGKLLFFPLNESAGELAYDETRRVKARVKNPGWMINHHFYWQPETRLRVSGQATVAYDEAHSRILIANNEAITAYYPRYAQTETWPFRILAKGGASVDDLIYNRLMRKTYLLVHADADGDRPPIAEAAGKKLPVTVLPVAGGENSLHHNRFFASDGDLYQFGGYRRHAYSDKLFRYNPQSSQWEAVDFQGDKMTPRFYSATGAGLRPNEQLVFGGFGNETGKQEHGGRNFYDLHRIDLGRKTITCLWNFPEISKIEFIPGNNLVLSADRKYFYALCYAYHLPNTTGYLYRFDVQNGTYDVMSDSLPFTSEDMNTSVNLFYNAPMNEFYAVVREYSEKKGTDIRIYSLLSPPVSKAQLESAVPVHPLHRMIQVGMIVIILLIVGLLYFLYRKKKQSKEAMQRSTQENEHDGKIQKQSAVYIFGNFTAYDKKGIDISYRFNLKLRVLFSLVLLHTKPESGISGKKLTEKMWPDKDFNNAKNIRGVTVNRLRNILEDIDGIQLVRQNSQWFFVFEPPFFCDYFGYATLSEQLHTTTPEAYPVLMEQLTAIMQNGTFLSDVHDAAIDDYKSKEEEKLIKQLRDYILYLYKEKQYPKINSVAAVFFQIDPLNEEILNICIKSYTKQGKKSEAKRLFKNYKRNYKNLTGEEYKGGDAKQRYNKLP